MGSIHHKRGDVYCPHISSRVEQGNLGEGVTSLLKVVQGKAQAYKHPSPQGGPSLRTSQEFASESVSPLQRLNPIGKLFMTFNFYMIDLLARLEQVPHNCPSQVRKFVIVTLSLSYITRWVITEPSSLCETLQSWGLHPSWCCQYWTCPNWMSNDGFYVTPPPGLSSITREEM